MTLSFSRLCDAMDAAGVEVRVALTDDGRHVIRLVDVHGLRSLDLQADRGFDTAALVACCSLGLCPDGPVARLWPELLALADLAVSGRGRPERLS